MDLSTCWWREQSRPPREGGQLSRFPLLLPARPHLKLDLLWIYCPWIDGTFKIFKHYVPYLMSLESTCGRHRQRCCSPRPPRRRREGRTRRCRRPRRPRTQGRTCCCRRLKRRENRLITSYTRYVNTYVISLITIVTMKSGKILCLSCSYLKIHFHLWYQIEAFRDISFLTQISMSGQLHHNPAGEFSGPLKCLDYA